MHATLPLVVAALFAGTTFAQGLDDHYLYLKFDAGAGALVTNFGAATGAPGDGTITRAPAAAPSWKPGRFGRALSGSDWTTSADHAYVATGFTGPVNGSFTLAWFQKQSGSSAPGTSISYLFGGLGSFRGFTGGIAQTGMIVRDWGGQPALLPLTLDVQTASASAWLHLALVVDTVAQTATWFVDGAAQTPIALTSTTVNITGTEFHVGKHLSDTQTSGYDLDEFRFVNRAVSAADVLAWSQGPSAADARYGKGCGATLTSRNGPPALGTPSYELRIQGAANAAWVLSVGTSRTALRFDLGLFDAALAGCYWESDLAILLSGITDASGQATLPLPIPAKGAAGVKLYDQALLLAPSQPTQSTNGLAIFVQKA